MNERDEIKQAFAVWYSMAHWGNEDFKTAVQRGYEAGWQASRAKPAPADAALVNLLRRAQAALSLDDTDRSLSNTEKLTLCNEIRAALAAARGDV